MVLDIPIGPRTDEAIVAQRKEVSMGIARMEWKITERMTEHADEEIDCEADVKQRTDRDANQRERNRVPKMNDRQPVRLLVTDRPDCLGRRTAQSLAEVQDHDRYIGQDCSRDHCALKAGDTAQERQIEQHMAWRMHLDLRRCKECLRKEPLTVDPLRFAGETGPLCHLNHLIPIELVAVFGLDRFPF